MSIDPDVHHRLRAKADANARSGQRSVRRYLLPGLVECGRCGNKMNGRTSVKRGLMIYICLKEHGGCSGLSVTAPPLEALVAEAIFEIVESPDFRKRLDRANGRDMRLEVERESLSARMAELARMWADGELTRQEWLSAKKRLQEHVDRLGELEAESATESPLDRWRDHSLREAWPTLTLDQRRAVAMAVISRSSSRPTTAAPRPASTPVG